MTTLEEAWEWYRATTEGARRLTHLARCWADLPWDVGHPGIDRLRHDSVLGQLDETELARDASAAGRGLDDLAVLVLFSVFEAQVRDWVLAQLQPEVALVQKLGSPAHPVVGAD